MDLPSGPRLSKSPALSSGAKLSSRLWRTDSSRLDQITLVMWRSRCACKVATMLSRSSLLQGSKPKHQ